MGERKLVNFIPVPAQLSEVARGALNGLNPNRSLPKDTLERNRELSRKVLKHIIDQESKN